MPPCLAKKNAVHAATHPHIQLDTAGCLCMHSMSLAQLAAQMQSISIVEVEQFLGVQTGLHCGSMPRNLRG